MKAALRLFLTLLLFGGGCLGAKALWDYYMYSPLDTRCACRCGCRISCTGCSRLRARREGQGQSIRP